MNKKILYDIAIIGAGPAGMAFACEFSNSKINVIVIEKSSKKLLSNPPADGRDVALTHHSVEILKKLNVWSYLPARSISKINEAKVMDGNSPYYLHFDHYDINKKTLGYLVSNQLIKKYLYKRLTSIPNVTLVNKVECRSIFTKDKYSLIQLTNGKKIKAHLVIAADGRFSKIRSKIGISTFQHNFKKDMVVCRMKHEKSNNNTAYEFFRYSQTQALLPLTTNQSSVITTISKDTSSILMKTSENKFNKIMRENFKNLFGKMKLIGKRHVYPLSTIYSKKFVDRRFALIGDAAIGMHPVTAQGFNLSLKGQRILVKEIMSAIKQKIDLGSDLILKKYQLKLHRLAMPLYLTTNGIVHLYTNNQPVIKTARQLILRMANTVKPIKQIFLRVLE